VAEVACPLHPSAEVLDPADPSNRDWLEGLDGLRRQRVALGLGLAAVVVCIVTSLAALWAVLLVGSLDPELHSFEPPAHGGWALLRAFTPARLGWLGLLAAGAASLRAAAALDGWRRRAATALPALIGGAALALELRAGGAGDDVWTLAAAAAAVVAAAALRRPLAGPDPADPWRALAEDEARARLQAAEPFALADLDSAEAPARRAAARAPRGRASGDLSGGG
jgi:hypothetical protein